MKYYYITTTIHNINIDHESFSKLVKTIRYRN
jgi:hypothetical protein